MAAHAFARGLSGPGGTSWACYSQYNKEASSGSHCEYMYITSCASTMTATSHSVKGFLQTCGFSWLHHRSRQLLPLRPLMPLAIRLQFFAPYSWSPTNTSIQELSAAPHDVNHSAFSPMSKLFKMVSHFDQTAYIHALRKVSHRHLMYFQTLEAAQIESPARTRACLQNCRA